MESLHSSPLLISAAFGRAASEPMASTALGFCRLCATYTRMHPELAHVLPAAMHASHNARAEDGPEVDYLPKTSGELSLSARWRPGIPGGAAGA